MALREKREQYGRFNLHALPFGHLVEEAALLRATTRDIGSRVNRIVCALAVGNDFLKVFHPWIKDSCRHADLLLEIQVYRACCGFDAANSSDEEG